MLKEQISEAARIAEAQCGPEEFNAMTWLDLVLEENPESFDTVFDTTWAELSDNERQERINALRKAL